MSNQQETPNNNSSDETELDYIQIDQKNKIEELTNDNHIILVSRLLKILNSNDDDNLGGEINKVFQSILPESKENDLFKLNISISEKSKIDNEHLENCLNDILNLPENNEITLTKVLSEQLSTILKEIFKKIKKRSKIKNFSQINEEVKKSINDFNQEDILKKYKNQKPVKMFSNLNYNDNDLFNNSDKRIKKVDNNNYESKSSFSLLNIKKKLSMHSRHKVLEKPSSDSLYKFKKYKKDNKYILPIEMLILIRKLHMVRKLKLSINNDILDSNINNDDFIENNLNNNSNNNGEIIDQNDLQNNICVLLNIDWLFSSLLELEVDFSNGNLTESIVNLYKYYLLKFSKLLHKDIKITTYSANSYNKRYYDPIRRSLFSQVNTHNTEDDHSSDVFSSSLSNLNYNFNFIQNNLNNNNFIII